ncbi:MAG: MoaD/ThiS family protein [Ignavibacteriales bacterium]
MEVSVRLFGTLRDLMGERRTVSLDAGTTVTGLLKSLGLEEKGISLTVVNGVQVEAAHVLQDGDQVMIVPPVIGG